MKLETLNATKRDQRGTRVSRQLRAAGQLPAVIYGHGEKPEHIALEQHDVEVSLAHGARTLGVKLGGKTIQYLIKEVQYDHLDAKPIHLDLARFDADERVKVMVSIELRGVPKGIADGGVLDQLIKEIEVECRVTDIPETFQPFVNDLGIGDSLLIKDLGLPADVTPLADGDDRVAIVKALVVAEEEETGGEEGEEAQQPEMIGRVKKDDEEDAKESK